MKTIVNRFLFPAAAATLSLHCLSAAPAFAQIPPPATASVVNASAKPVPAFRFKDVLARDAAAQLSKTTGAIIVTDSTVSIAPVTLSSIGGPLPTVLKQVVGVLPKGATVVTIMLPAFTPKAPLPSGDDLAALYNSQEHLVSPVMGGKVERGVNSINVLGKILPEDKATPIIVALDLRPVYLITNPDADNNPVSKSAQLQAEGMRLWAAMTPDQRIQAAEQQFNSILNMDSPTRQAMFSQSAQFIQTMSQKIQSMPAEQRNQFISDLTGGMKMPPPPGAGNGGAKP